MIPDISRFTLGVQNLVLADRETGLPYYLPQGSDTPAVMPAGSSAWGSIGGTLSNQTDLQTALNAKGTSNFSGAYADLTGQPALFDGVYASLTGKPTLGTAAATDASAYATAAQGTKADSAVQPAGLTKAAVGLGNCDNTSDASKPISTATQTALNGKQAAGSYATGTGTANGTNTGDQTITLTGDVTGSGTGSFATAIGAGKVTDAMKVETSAATPATTGTMTVNMTTEIITITPTGACTFNASGGRLGRIITFSITTSGTSSFTLTCGTNFRKTGTLATGTTSARFFAVTFRCINGTIWQEIARTAVQT